MTHAIFGEFYKNSYKILIMHADCLQPLNRLLPLVPPPLCNVPTVYL